MQIKYGDHRHLFCRDRYFSYHVDDTNVNFNIARRLETEEAKSKFDSAIYVGDKVPQLYRRLRHIDEAFPGCTVIYIVRDPLHVASSWQRRADANNDPWPERNGFQQAVVEWNESLRFALRARSHLGTVLFSFPTKDYSGHDDGLFGANSCTGCRSLFDQPNLPKGS